MIEQPPRIFFDSNAVIEGGYALWFETSRRDLTAVGDRLRAGLIVVIYIPGELEMQAVLAFDDEHKTWVARGIDGSIRYLDGARNSNPLP